MVRLSYLELGLLATTAFCTPFESAQRPVLQHWQRTGTPGRNETLKLQISLASPNQHLLEEHLLRVSDPSSKQWRQHLGKEDIRSLMQPDEESILAASEWLASAGIQSRYHRDMLLAEATIEQAENLLNSTYWIYEDSTGRKVLRTEEYYVPQDLHEHIQLVSPTVHFPSVRPVAELKRRQVDNFPNYTKRDGAASSANSSLESACGPSNNISVGSDCVKLLYSIDWTASSSNTSFAIFDADTDSANSTDLQSYLQAYGINATDVSISEIHAAGWDVVYANVTGEETNLDFQTSTGLTWPVVPDLLRADVNAFEGYRPEDYDDENIALSLQFLHEMAYNDTVPPVVSISAGINEPIVPQAYAQRACALIAASSARGVTWIASSGDTGPSSPAYAHNYTINPQWPATCPWVLAVGGTADPYNETAATVFTTNGQLTTGGGFSNYFARPSYQDSVVSQYVNSSITPAFAAQSGFNASGRGYPDVAAIGYNIPIVLNGKWGMTFGTSASAPIWAGIITLLNDFEASRGKPTLGFVNPWLYSLGDGNGLKDITVCNGSRNVLSHGAMAPIAKTSYNGSVGWDACTGLGVPVFDRLRANLAASS